MPCFLLLILLLFPRVALVLMWIFSTYLQRAFHGGPGAAGTRLHFPAAHHDRIRMGTEQRHADGGN